MVLNLCLWILLFKIMVLIFSNTSDQSTNNVMDWLNYYNVQSIRINGDDDRYVFHHLDSTGIYFWDRRKDIYVNIENANSCWWRRQSIRVNKLTNTNPSLRCDNSFDISPFVNSGNKWLSLEATRLREYIYKRLYAKIPINLGMPSFDFNRLEIFILASECGLLIPEFAIITNSSDIKRYKELWGGCVSKAISNGLYDEHGDNRYYTYTELVSPFDKDIVLFPSLISKNIEKSFEIRSFYLNGEFYSMAIFSQTDELTRIDYRKYANNRNEPFLLPKDIERKTNALFEKIGINTGSVDYMVDKSGDYYFLEINPVGQYGMTDFPCNYQLDCKIAKYLAYGRN